MARNFRSRGEAVKYIADVLGYGADNAESWTLSAGFADGHVWTHPAGTLSVRWSSRGYAVEDETMRKRARSNRPS